MIDDLENMKDSLQDALDILSSSRSSSQSRTKALLELDHLLAQISLGKNASEILHNFSALQHTFECNVPSRLLNWISQSLPLMESLINKGPTDSRYLDGKARCTVTYVLRRRTI